MDTWYCQSCGLCCVDAPKLSIAASLEYDRTTHLAQIIVILEHPLARNTVRMSRGVLMMLIASILTVESTVAVVALVLRAIVVDGTGIYMHVISILGEPALTWTAVVIHLAEQLMGCWSLEFMVVQVLRDAFKRREGLKETLKFYYINSYPLI